MIVGEGRAGKTSFSNSITGKGFSKDLQSTVGINQLECTVSYATRDTAGACGEYIKEQFEFEAALAEMMKNKDFDSNGAELSMVELMKLKKDHAKKAAKKSVDNPLYRVSSKKLIDVNHSDHNGHQVDFTQTKNVQIESPVDIGNMRATYSADVDDPFAHVRSSSTNAKKKKVGKAKSGVNDEVLQTCLASNINNSSNLIISVFDYGGQPVFNVIHHLFLTQNGVYVLVFNMEWLALTEDTAAHQKCLNFLSFWINSIILHTSNNVNNKAAPIALVGTRKDVISDPALHERISLLLYNKFSGSNAWSSVIQNVTATGTQGTTNLCFFPVDNTRHLRDPTIQTLMLNIENVMKGNDFTTRMVPLTWLKSYDLMQQSNESCLSLSDVTEKCRSAGVDASEVEYFLTFMHEMGILLWHNEPTLRDVVILDAVQYFVRPATVIICKYAPDATDATNHTMQEHVNCRDNCRLDWTKFTKTAILSATML